MRPPESVFRLVVAQLAEMGRATWRQVYAALVANEFPVTERSVRQTVENLARRGWLAAVDTKRVPWSRRPMRVYALAAAGDSGPSVLVSVLSSWGRT